MEAENSIYVAVKTYFIALGWCSETIMGFHEST